MRYGTGAFQTKHAGAEAANGKCQSVKIISLIVTIEFSFRAGLNISGIIEFLCGQFRFSSSQQMDRRCRTYSSEGEGLYESPAFLMILHLQMHLMMIQNRLIHIFI